MKIILLSMTLMMFSSLSFSQDGPTSQCDLGCGLGTLNVQACVCVADPDVGNSGEQICPSVCQIDTCAPGAPCPADPTGPCTEPGPPPCSGGLQ